MSVSQHIPSDGSAPAFNRVLVHPNRWLPLVILGFGFTTWAAFLYVGIRARRRSWLAWAALYSALFVLSVVLDYPANPSPWAPNIAAIGFLLAWLGGTVHAAAIRHDAARQMRWCGAGLEAARQRIERRAEGQRLANGDPRLAREVGVGCPDVPGADDFGLVDINHASKDALCRLPGITPELAERVAETRERVGSFTSVEDVGACADLPPSVVDVMRDYVVFL